MTGRTLSHYKVLEKIGEGGMGEVYLAKDTKLDREVAVKVLPATFSENKERLARFEREARLLASLNHPNIAAIHEIEESDGVHFLALEYVPGETLAERIKRGPIPIDEALPLFKQIAEGLEAAHEKGVIHRDLKPANVKVTPEGKVKVLDFGLAKAMAGEVPALDASQSPTLTKDTALGAILGTAAYMSPEQARGKPVDKRTDIWAFGCCLYEALTGKTAFLGETVSDTIAAVIGKEPDWEEISAIVPESVRTLLHRCLHKDLDGRIHDVADARIEIEEATAHPLGTTAAEGPAPRRPASREILLWGVTAVALMAAAFALWMGQTSLDTDEASRAMTRFTISLGGDQRVAMDIDEPLIAITRDGRRLAWIGRGTPERRIYTRSLEELTVRPISGTEGVDNVFIFFSPDGRWVAFSRDAALWKIPIEGGVAARLFQGESTWQIYGGDWGDDGSIVFGVMNSGLLRISEGGGKPEFLTHPDGERGEIQFTHPHILPRHRGVLFTVNVRNLNEGHLEALDLDTGNRHVVIENTFTAKYINSGYIVFARDGTLFAAAFDLDRLEVVGPETPVLSNVQSDTETGRVAEFAVSRNGTLAYIPGGQGFSERRLAWVRRDGETELIPLPPGPYNWPALSPDATQMAVVRNEGHVHHVHLYEPSRSVLTQFTFEGSWNWAPVWSPDGSHIAFQSTQAGQFNLFVKPAGGDTPAVHLQDSPNNQRHQLPLSWSPDGSLLAYLEHTTIDRLDVWLLSMDQESHRPVPFLVSEFDEGGASFSPAGDWIAYVSNEEGQPEIFIREFTRDPIKAGQKKKVTRDGGFEPVWSRDGRELFYRSLDGGRLLSVSIRNEPELEVGEQKVVLEGLALYQGMTWFEAGAYDVSPDGERFLMVLEDRTPETMELVVVLNWFEELKRLVPTN